MNNASVASDILSGISQKPSFNCERFGIMPSFNINIVEIKIAKQIVTLSLVINHQCFFLIPLTTVLKKNNIFPNEKMNSVSKGVLLVNWGDK